MTDKQIINDEYWKKKYADIHIRLTNKIAELEDQLKRKEQECEDLKIYIESNEQQVKEVETLVMDNDRLINELNQLKQSLTEIKDIVETNYINAEDIEYSGYNVFAGREMTKEEVKETFDRLFAKSNILSFVGVEGKSNSNEYSA